MATSNEAAPLRALRALGFSEIDARVYAYLLENEPTTGYRISHAIGKPTANTYKAIASLEQQGAVRVDETSNRLVRAVPPRELMAQLERSFRDRKNQALESLGELNQSRADDRLYALRTVDQVLERGRAMIRRARGVIVADLFPGPERELRSELARASGRGVQIALKVYRREAADSSPPKIRLVTPCEAEDVLSAWPGEQITLVADAEEHLIALLDREMSTVCQAVWSRSNFLSCLHHNHVAMEIAFTAWESGRRVSAVEAERRMQEVRFISLLRARPSGLRKLQKRFPLTGHGAGSARSDPGKAIVRTRKRSGKELQP